MFACATHTKTTGFNPLCILCKKATATANAVQSQPVAEEAKAIIPVIEKAPTEVQILPKQEEEKDKKEYLTYGRKLDFIYNVMNDILKAVPNDSAIIKARGFLHEMIAEEQKNPKDFNDSPEDSQKQSSVLTPDKIAFHVAGLQLIENNVIKGTALYQKMHSARVRRDILNKKFADLNVKHEAKIIQYPVYE